ncbi:MAG: M56 family metallopeptidase [Miniphocaeibacter sp.]|uniref:M56 family metallopeptidase n=1 Tax=Miniphocaeibacter sp. TaxID=3100973 RepID=UPI00182935F2|nr:hypothetical protein [Gallicola sp.]
MNIQEIFLEILNMSFVASFIIGVVILARLLLKRFPKIFSYILWLPVLVRLLIPFSIEGLFSLIPVNKRPIPSNIVYNSSARINTGINIVDRTVNNPVKNTIKEVPTALVENPIDYRQIIIYVLIGIWIAGMAFMLIKAIISAIKLKKKLVGSIKLRENIYLSDYINTAFVVGIRRPKIYLPSYIENKEYIILHEQVHIKRRDNIIKILAYIALSIHWFNPLVWLAFVLSTNDMELSCDEKVMRNMNKEIKADYAQSLLNISTGRRKISGISINFGEEDVKERVKNIMKHKKARKWKIILASVLSLVVLVGCFGNNGKSYISNIKDKDLEEFDYLPNIVYGDDKQVIFYDIGTGVVFYDLKDSKVTNRIEYDELVKTYKDKETVGIEGVSKDFKKIYSFAYNDILETSYYEYDISKGTTKERKEGGLDLPDFNSDDDYVFRFSEDGKRRKYKDIELLVYNGDEKTKYKVFGKPSDTKTYEDIENEILGKKISKDINNVDIEKDSIWLFGSPNLLYGDKEKAIITGYFGLVVYDLNNSKESKIIPLETIEDIVPQKPNFTIVKVSKDGNRVYFGKEMNLEEGQRYLLAEDEMSKYGEFTHVYNVVEDKLEKISTQPKSFFESRTYYSEEQIKIMDEIAMNSSGGVVELDDSFMFLGGKYLNPGNEDATLEIVIHNYKTGENKVYKIFE